ncbi:MAG TPA: hypothetical protein VLZ84_04315 [Asticcacaulis sp.]|nr:hypothetical protein [Asticcacaulis sp.]
MNISRDDAAKALSEIARTEGRGRELTGYRIAGPILMVWGVIWIIGYAAMGYLPMSQWGAVWIPADVIGIIASIFMGYRARCAPGAGAIRGWRTLGYALLITVFCGGTFAVLQPADVNGYIAFPGLLTGGIYAAIGLARMPRFMWVGATVITFTLMGFYLMPAHLAYWMAATGGGGLLVSGYLLRRA